MQTEVAGSGDSGDVRVTPPGGRIDGINSGATGRWATEQLIRSLNEGREPSSDDLRTLDTLRRDEWIEFDDALIEAATIRLRGIADLRRMGLVKRIRGGLGKTILQYEKIGDMTAAQVTMDGRVRTEDDRPDLSPGYLPLPLIHKDWSLNIRTLMAGRERGESLDTYTQRKAGTKIAEKLEELLFIGGPQFGGLPIYGYLNHPGITEIDFTDTAWGTGTTSGDDILADVLAAKQIMLNNQFWGPYQLYVSPDMDLALTLDFKANGDKTIRQRLMDIDQLQGITVADQIPAGRAILVQMTAEVVELVEGEPLQNIQWDIEGGMHVNFKSYTMQVPLLRSSTRANAKTGIVVIRAL